jgi:hypothetical protein
MAPLEMNDEISSGGKSTIGFFKLQCWINPRFATFLTKLYAQQYRHYVSSRSLFSVLVFSARPSHTWLREVLTTALTHHWATIQWSGWKETPEHPLMYSHKRIRVFKCKHIRILFWIQEWLSLRWNVADNCCYFLKQSESFFLMHKSTNRKFVAWRIQEVRFGDMPSTDQNSTALNINTTSSKSVSLFHTDSFALVVVVMRQSFKILKVDHKISLRSLPFRN